MTSTITCTSTSSPLPTREWTSTSYLFRSVGIATSKRVWLSLLLLLLLLPTLFRSWCYIVVQLNAREREKERKGDREREKDGRTAWLIMRAQCYHRFELVPTFHGKRANVTQLTHYQIVYSRAFVAHPSLETAAYLVQDRKYKDSRPDWLVSSTHVVRDIEKMVETGNEIYFRKCTCWTWPSKCTIFLDDI